MSSAAKRRLIGIAFMVAIAIGVLASASEAALTSQRRALLIVVVVLFGSGCWLVGKRFAYVAQAEYVRSLSRAKRAGLWAAPLLLAVVFLSVRGAAGAAWLGAVGGLLGGLVWNAPLRPDRGTT